MLTGYRLAISLQFDDGALMTRANDGSNASRLARLLISGEQFKADSSLETPRRAMASALRVIKRLFRARTSSRT